jgi:DNA-binding MarR family transcriptional regulator
MAKKTREGLPDGEFQNQDGILLGVLAAVDRDSKISQRAISRELGVALGLANAYLKRCVRKGWIKIQQVPRRRYAYYLTPQGFAEKTRLTGQYLAVSLTFFRRAREQMSNLLAECVEEGWCNIALAGISDLAEVATICSHDYPIKIVAIIDPAHSGEKFGGVTVQAAFDKSQLIDAVIVTSVLTPEETYHQMAAEIGPKRVLAPRVLRIVMPDSVAPTPSEFVAR